MSELAKRLESRVRSTLHAWRHAERALAPDEGPSYLPWIVGIMTFLAAFALAAALALSGTAARWTAGMAGTMTVEIAAESPGDTRTAPQRLDAALQILRATPGIVRAEPISRDDLARMLEPWLGPGSASPDLPLPQLIDVTRGEDAGLDVEALRERLAAEVPGTAIDDHRRWLGGLLRLAHAAVLLALAIVVLVGVAAAGTVVFATHAGLAAHRHAIELLHLMGAHDRYVARQFARLVLMRGALGAAAGAGAALLAFHALVAAAQARTGVASAGAAAGPWLGVGDWTLLLALPIAIVAVATLAAWHTVIKTLRAMV